MPERLFRIQGLIGQMHDGRWCIKSTSERLGIQLASGMGHDLDDLAESIYGTILRFREISDQGGLTVEIGSAELTALAARLSESVPSGRWGWGSADVPTRRELLTHLELACDESTGSANAELTVAISSPRTPALTDPADLVGALSLRDVDASIACAKVRGRRLSSNPMLLPPLLPVDGHLLTDDDPRFVDLIRPHRDLRELVRSAPPTSWSHVHEVLDLVCEIRDELRGSTIEAEAASVLRSMLGERAAWTWAGPLGRRLGLEGRVETLAAVANELGVTRERVRQVQSKLVLPQQPIWAPSMEAAIKLIEHAIPCSASDLAESLSAAGLSDLRSWEAASLCATASLTGRSLDLVEVDGFVGRPDQLAGLKAVLPAARAASNFSGLATMWEVLNRLSDQSIQLDGSLVRDVLVKSPVVHWVDDQSFWTDHAPGRNRLVNTSLRILAVIQPQSLTDMHEGIVRHYRWRSASGSGRFPTLTAPYPSQLSAFYASHPAFALDRDDCVIARQPVDIESLGAEKLAMVGVLRSQPFWVMDRNSLIDACRDAGMKAATAGVFTTYAECIKNFGHNVWGLRGAVVPDEVVLATQRRARVTRQSYDRHCVRGATQSGRPWMARKVTPTFLNSGVMPFDWGKDALADRKLTALDMLDGEQIGTLRFVNGFNYGYVPYIGKHSMSVGDVIRVLADPESGVCHIESGGDELLSEPFDF